MHKEHIPQILMLSMDIRYYSTQVAGNVPSKIATFEQPVQAPCDPTHPKCLEVVFRALITQKREHGRREDMY